MKNKVLPAKKDKIEIKPFKVDPITIYMPRIEAKFTRFETSNNGQKFYVIYELTEQI